MGLILQWGKYKGHDIESVPQDYLVYMEKWHKEGYHQVVGELRRRQQVEEAELPLVERIVAIGFRELSKSIHPDKGGSQEEMQKLGASRDLLREAIRVLKE